MYRPVGYQITKWLKSTTPRYQVSHNDITWQSYSVIPTIVLEALSVLINQIRKLWTRPKSLFLITCPIKILLCKAQSQWSWKNVHWVSNVQFFDCNQRVWLESCVEWCSYLPLVTGRISRLLSCILFLLNVHMLPVNLFTVTGSLHSHSFASRGFIAILHLIQRGSKNKNKRNILWHNDWETWNGRFQGK